jgi:hypothetical protein
MQKQQMKFRLLGVCCVLWLCSCGEPATTEVEVVEVDSPNSTPAATINTNGGSCELFPAGLLEQVGMGYQMVRNLALAGGKNLATMEKNNMAPAPETFRSFADVFEQLDVSGVETLPNFDKPEIAAPSIRELADKLEAALTQKDNLDHPAWSELAEFSKRPLNRQQQSVNYYLSELGCL